MDPISIQLTGCNLLQGHYIHNKHLRCIGEHDLRIAQQAHIEHSLPEVQHTPASISPNPSTPHLTSPPPQVIGVHFHLQCSEALLRCVLHSAVTQRGTGFGAALAITAPSSKHEVIQAQRTRLQPLHGGHEEGKHAAVGEGEDAGGSDDQSAEEGVEVRGEQHRGERFIEEKELLRDGTGDHEHAGRRVKLHEGAAAVYGQGTDGKAPPALRSDLWWGRERRRWAEVAAVDHSSTTTFPSHVASDQRRGEEELRTMVG